MIVSWDTEHAPFTEYEKILPVTCVSFAYENGDPAGLLHARDPDARAIVADWLTHHVSVGAQIAHDMAEVCNEWPDLIPLVWEAYADGRVRDLIQCQRLIDIADGRRAEGGPGNLDELAQAYGHPPLDKDPAVRLSYGPLRDLPLDQWSPRQRTYPVDDALAGLHVALSQPLPVDWQNAAYADFLCVLMGAWGFRTDLGRVAALRVRYQAELERTIALLADGPPLRRLNKSKRLAVPDAYTTTELLAAPILRKNPANKTGYSENTYVTLARMAASGATRVTKRKDGKPSNRLSCDAEACENSGDPLLIALAKYASTEKSLGDCDALARGELHCWFKPVMTNNQTSCSNPYNAQNVPTSGGERECIVPRPGTCFIDADYDLFQLRTFSQVCLELVGQSTMADFLNEGRNLHSALAEIVMGIPTGTFDKKADRLLGDKSRYDMCKRCNFGFGADMGYKRFAATCSKQGVVVTEEDFWRYKNAWKQLFPEAQRYFDYISSLGDGATITELFTGRVRGGCSYTDAANGYFSALAASAGKAAWFQVARECYDPSRHSVLFGDRPVNWVHDQLLIETPLGPGAHDHAMRVKEIMESATRPFLPDVPATTTPCLASCWSKQTEEVLDTNGRLLVWSPT